MDDARYQVDYVTVYGPCLPVEGRRCKTVSSARSTRDRLDRQYGASRHTYKITYLGDS